MPRHVCEIEINEGTSLEDVQLFLTDATFSSHTYAQKAAARSRQLRRPDYSNRNVSFVGE